MDEVDVMVGQRIRACRRARKLSQADLGRAIGVRFQQIQKYESGTNRVSASKLWAIAEALDVDVVFFFGGIQNENGAHAQDGMPYLKDCETVEMIEIFQVLPREQKDAVLNVIRSLADCMVPKVVSDP